MHLRMKLSCILLTVILSHIVCIAGRRIEDKRNDYSLNKNKGKLGTLRHNNYSKLFGVDNKLSSLPNVKDHISVKSAKNYEWFKQKVNNLNSNLNTVKGRRKINLAFTKPNKQIKQKRRLFNKKKDLLQQELFNRKPNARVVKHPRKMNFVSTPRMIINGRPVELKHQHQFVLKNKDLINRKPNNFNSYPHTGMRPGKMHFFTNPQRMASMKTPIAKYNNYNQHMPYGKQKTDKTKFRDNIGMDSSEMNVDISDEDWNIEREFEENKNNNENKYNNKGARNMKDGVRFVGDAKIINFDVGSSLNGASFGKKDKNIKLKIKSQTKSAVK